MPPLRCAATATAATAAAATTAAAAAPLPPLRCAAAATLRCRRRFYCCHRCCHQPLPLCLFPLLVSIDKN
jgi:hypothetical protein